MSQDFMDPELFADFIVEAKEHLETIEPNLLELEKSPDNLSLLNEIFRPMHSLKGASGFLGLNRINELAHRAENVLDELRKGSIPVNSEIMDVILSATDALRQMIDNLATTNAEGDVHIESITERLDEIMKTGGAIKVATPANDVSTQVSTAAPEDLNSQNSVEQEIKIDTTLDNNSENLEEKEENSSQKAKSENFQSEDVESWIESLESIPTYQLTAFGEEHLKDFIEEAKENISDLSSGLLELEKNPNGQAELVNDLFRYFHNLKGNSGIIGYNEVNGLTHEAETLLNAVRKENYPVTTELVDLLLLVVDILESLIYRIEASKTEVSPFDISEILTNLKEAVAGGKIQLPASLIKHNKENNNDLKDPNEEIKAFKRTISTQDEIISNTINKIKENPEDLSLVDTLHRALLTIESACRFMNMEEIEVYAKRTAGIIEQANKSNLDFSLLLDLIEQECAIIHDMAKIALEKINANTAPDHTENKDAKLPKNESSSSNLNENVDNSASKEQLTKLQESKDVAKTAPEHDGKDQAEELKTHSEKSATPEDNNASKNSKDLNSTKPSNKAAPAKQAASTQKHDEAGHRTSSTIRVDHEKLDHLMNLIGELIINRNRFAMLARQLEEQGNSDISTIAQNLTETTYAMARISDELQDTIMKVRMVPVASVFSRFPRLIRDLSRKSNKEVELIIEGDDTELDKNVVEVIGDPLVHLIRNSVDHGIEPAEIRKESGKSPIGHIYLRAYYKGNSVVIEIEDDGKGIDPEKMLEVAIRKGIITHEEGKLLDDREAIELIFAPGFSSAEVITDISGRGVGMDVVRTNIKNLKGSINIVSEVGKGSKFVLTLPLTLAIIDALMVNVAGGIYAIPLDAVSETTKIESSLLTDIKGRKAVTLRGNVLGLVSLADLLGMPCNMEKSELLSVVIIHDNDRLLGLVVDSMLERQEVVIKPLGSYLGDIKGISGATIMGDGGVVLILDPHEIYSLATSRAMEKPTSI